MNDWNDGISNDPSIGVDGAGTIHVVWEDNTAGEFGSDYDTFYCNYTTANGWSNATDISDNADHGYNPDIAVTTAGAVHVVWEDSTDGGWWGTDREIWYINYTSASGWSVTTVISDDTNDWNKEASMAPAIAVEDSTGYIHVAWDDETEGVWGSDYEIMVCNFTPGVGWSNATVVSDDATDWNNDEGDDPDIAVDTSGDVHVVWSDSANGEWGTDNEIMYAHTGSGWSNATVISDDASLWNNESSNVPVVAVDNSGIVHIVWYDGTPGAWGPGLDYEIMYTNNDTIPHGPANVTYPSSSTGSVFFNWTAVSWADRYLIYRDTAPLSGLSDDIFLNILSSGTLIGNVTTINFTDTLTVSDTYYYAIVAHNDTTGANSTAKMFGPITVTVSGGGNPIDPNLIGVIVLLVIIFAIVGACGGLFVLHKKEKIDLNKWKDTIVSKVKGSPASTDAKASKKVADKIEPKKKVAPAKPVPAEKKVEPTKETSKPKKAAKQAKSKKKKTKKAKK